METDTAATESAWQLGKGPFIFIGMPPICRGEIELKNKSDRKIKIRGITTTDHASGSMAARGFGEVKIRTRLAPLAQALRPAHFSIDQHTPPGTYRTKIVTGKQREPAVIHVLENPDFRVTPSRIVTKGGSGDQLEHVLVIHNHGNVTHTLHDIGMVWLEEEDWVGRTFVYTLRESPDKTEGHQPFLDRVMGEFHKSMIPPVRVRLRYDDKEIKPGDTREVFLSMVLPDGLKKGRTYFGFIKLMGKRLWVEVRCTRSPKPREATRRKK